MEEQDMEMVLEDDIPLYDVVEVDFDYEFDAARFFDFSKPESQAEARISELWFNSAPNYPPSPFVAKLFQTEGYFSQNADALPLSNYDDGMSVVDDDADIHHEEQYSYQDKPYQEKSSQTLWNAKGGSLHDAQKQPECLFGGQSTGLTFYNHLANDMKKTKTKSFAKPHMPRSSTLMKPTASQLAKQKQRQQAIDVRFKIGEGLSTSHCGTENQAAKRQKLDGGLSRKIVDMKQPNNLTHKIPKKDIAPQGMNLQSKLRITIPREPDLETAHRAERTSRSVTSKEGERPTSTIGRYKARPFNKKILEAPACTIPKRNTPHVQDIQTFRFRTSERTKQTSSTAATTLCQTTKGLNKANPTSIPETISKDGKSCDSVDAQKLAERPFAHTFKARPLDKKILTSRGDLGVFRNSKRDVTVPKEFAFQTAKRNHQNPPVELFSKLSLAGEQKNVAKQQLPQRTCIFSKGSKENRWELCQEGQNVKRDTQDTHKGKQTLDVTSSGAGELGPGNAMIRTGPLWRQ